MVGHSFTSYEELDFMIFYRHQNVNEILLQLPLLRHLVDEHRRVEIRDRLCHRLHRFWNDQD